MFHKILEGKRGIIFGALDEMSIAWKTAEAVKLAGGEFVLTNAPVALRMGKIDELAKKTDSEIFPADVTKEDDLNKLVEFTLNHFNSKLDFVLHSKLIHVKVMIDKIVSERVITELKENLPAGQQGVIISFKPISENTKHTQHLLLWVHAPKSQGLFVAGKRLWQDAWEYSPSLLFMFVRIA